MFPEMRLGLRSAHLRDRSLVISHNSAVSAASPDKRGMVKTLGVELLWERRSVCEDSSYVEMAGHRDAGSEIWLRHVRE